MPTPLQIKIGSTPAKPTDSSKFDSFTDDASNISFNFKILDPTGSKIVQVIFRLGAATPVTYTFADQAPNVIPHPTLTGAYVLSAPLYVYLGGVNATKFFIDCTYYQ